ncbi:hypothetical protein Tco_1282728 [Tanacetum coccineum]
MKGEIDPYLGEAARRRVCRHGGSDTLLYGPVLASLSQTVSISPSIMSQYGSPVIVTQNSAPTLYGWPTTQTLSINCGTCTHVLASTTILASVLEQVARAHRETMITHGCCPKVNGIAVIYVLSKKIRRICAITSQDIHDEKRSIRRIRRAHTPYLRMEYNIRGAHVKLPQYAVLNPFNTVYQPFSRLYKYKTLKLVLEFDQFSDVKDHFEEEVTETVGEPAMEEYMPKTREDYGSRIARPKFGEKARPDGIFFKKYYPPSCAGRMMETNGVNTKVEWDPTIIKFENWLASKFRNHKMMDQYTKNALWLYWKRGDDEELINNDELSNPGDENLIEENEIAQIFRNDTNIFHFETPL